VINGVVAVPVMAIMMLMAVNAKVMGEFTIPVGMRVIGWGATLVMGLAVIGMALAAWV
jgi:Mn2+/Fe2+ NRAMP family transporter